LLVKYIENKINKTNINARKILKIEKINKKGLKKPSKSWGSYIIDIF
jgi:hypothetical protein